MLSASWQMVAPPQEINIHFFKINTYFEIGCSNNMSVVLSLSLNLTFQTLPYLSEKVSIICAMGQWSLWQKSSLNKTILLNWKFLLLLNTFVIFVISQGALYTTYFRICLQYAKSFSTIYSSKCLVELTEFTRV